MQYNLFILTHRAFYMIKPFTAVRVVNFPENDPLNNQLGTVIGVAMESHGTAFYIVMFDHSVQNGYPAIVIIDSCLKPVN